MDSLVWWRGLRGLALLGIAQREQRGRSLFARDIGPRGAELLGVRDQHSPVGALAFAFPRDATLGVDHRGQRPPLAAPLLNDASEDILDVLPRQRAQHRNLLGLAVVLVLPCRDLSPVPARLIPERLIRLELLRDQTPHGSLERLLREVSDRRGCEAVHEREHLVDDGGCFSDGGLDREDQGAHAILLLVGRGHDVPQLLLRPQVGEEGLVDDAGDDLHGHLVAEILARVLELHHHRRVHLSGVRLGEDQRLSITCQLHGQLDKLGDRPLVRRHRLELEGVFDPLHHGQSLLLLKVTLDEGLPEAFVPQRPRPPLQVREGDLLELDEDLEREEGGVVRALPREKVRVLVRLLRHE
mmetsp:Transcript_20219/g.48874  ORF Transcript_20219/g.48874 Transcript_20219/m.48874 type:complete len:355 (-) Transcript_20219:2463-3527(-)